MPKTTDDRRLTISVAARRKSRFCRTRIEYPAWVVNGTRRPPFDVALARELLARTGELPSSRGDLRAVLAEYRHALAALAAERG
jgi:hypothetical protein